MARSVVALGLVLALVVLVIWLGRQGQAAPQPSVSHKSPVPAVKTPEQNDGGLVVEGLSEPEVTIGSEQLVSLEPPMQKVEDATAASGWCLTVPEGPNHQELNPAAKALDGKEIPNGTAMFSVTIDTPGEYVLWAHKWWCCSCGDSFRYSVDGGPLTDFISDSNYQVWEWAKTNNSRISLSKGTHKLVIANREDGFRVDRFLLSMGSNSPAPLKSK